VKSKELVRVVIIATFGIAMSTKQVGISNRAPTMQPWKKFLDITMDRPIVGQAAIIPMSMLKNGIGNR
jgi:hypothetical protein